MSWFKSTEDKEKSKQTKLDKIRNATDMQLVATAARNAQGRFGWIDDDVRSEMNARGLFLNFD